MKRFIYLIENEDNGYIKIGIGVNPNQRIKALQTGSTGKLKLLYKKEVQFASKIESVLHRQYKEQRISGEWFDLYGFDLKDIYYQIDVTEKNFIMLKEYDNPFI